ncbi:MAG TPA: S1-like domain-containing RNA-binding protein [Bdellovibrionales bacterium]|nr:S1-like domain-containing RNA-binding protein [Bdellovibrionales bacterium]
MERSVLVEIGNFNELKAVREATPGVYLDGGDLGEILLPRRQVPEDLVIGDSIEVFIYYDSEDRLIATTEEPYVTIGKFAHLRVVSLERVGAFLDWGLSKDLFLPFSEQTRDLKVGHDVIVYVYLDKSNRISASMRLERFMDKSFPKYEVGEKVDLMIAAETDLGYKAIINGSHFGVLYANEVFKKLEHGEILPGYIKEVRQDGKIDLLLQPMGSLGKDDLGQKILEELKSKGGFLPLNNHTSAETIYELFGVSKKKYKMALGGLYKSRLITIDDEGIRLTPKGEK